MPDGKSRSRHKRRHVVSAEGGRTVRAEAPLTDLAFPTSTLWIAMVQLSGPGQEKIRAVVDSRETLQWHSLGAISARLDKACKILDFLFQQHPEVQLVVFPEYSIAVEESLPVLQSKADAHRVTIVAGSDNIRRGPKQIYNQCAVVIPNRNPVWVTKCHVSKWEVGVVDEPPPKTTNPVLGWTVDDIEYRLRVSICLDFTTIVREGASDDGHPVIHVVPMCSPEMQAFRVYADTLLWEEKGRAVVLCNCVGSGAAGQSAIYALTPTGQHLEPVHELSDHKEGIAVFELHCDSLVLPKRTPQYIRSAVGRVFTYDLLSSEAGLDIVSLPDTQGGHLSKTRAVLNPALFEYYGKRMRVAFLSVESYGKIDETSIRAQGYECYSVLGMSDMMVTHLHADAYAMIFDIAHTLGQLDEDATAKFPYFEVERFHKVLGMPIMEADLHAFELTAPTAEDLTALLALGRNWSDTTVTQEQKERFRQKRWILGITDRSPGAISAVMSVYIDHPQEMTKPLRDFEDRILPGLKEDPAITSIFEGTGHRQSTHFLLRITCGVSDLFALIERIHREAVGARLILRTNTYVIMKKWSDLGLEKNLLLAELPKQKARFRDSVLRPLLPPVDWEALVTKRGDVQEDIIDTIQSLREIITRLAEFPWLREEIVGVERDLVLGIVRNEYGFLTRPHDLLQSKVEDKLRLILKKCVEEVELDSWRTELGIQHTRPMSGLSYTDRLKLAIKAVELERLDSQLSSILKDLLTCTVKVRNAVSHGEWGRISIDEYRTALDGYGEFLRLVGTER